MNGFQITYNRKKNSLLVGSLGNPGGAGYLLLSSCKKDEVNALLYFPKQYISSYFYLPKYLLKVINSNKIKMNQLFKDYVSDTF